VKEIFEIRFSTKVSASPIAKGLTEPLVKVLEKSVPLLERIAEAYIKQLEKELQTESK
jgi:hypothetical protein